MDQDSNKMKFSFKFKIPGAEKRLSIRIQLNNDIEDLTAFDDKSFENIVVKAALIASEYVKLKEKKGIITIHDPSVNRLPGDHSFGINYNPSNKTADFKKLKEDLSDSFDWLIEKDYPPGMIKKYKGSYNLNIDPRIVSQAKEHFNYIFDEIMKTFL